VSERVVLALFLLTAAIGSPAQSGTQRSFQIPVEQVRAALKKLPGGTAGALPTVEGFVAAGDHPLTEYRRPYYQCTVRVLPLPSGGSVVRVKAKVTAWNNNPAHSGYEILVSNGRIESDLLDRLEESLGSAAGPPANTAAENGSRNAASNQLSTGKRARSASPPPQISAPMPQLPSAREINIKPTAAASSDPALDQEAKNLEELLRNQSHPTDLVAVRQDQTPVLQDPSADAKVLFYAKTEDEFEILDLNPEWVHVRISGLSRGWLRRSGVEMLNGTESFAETQSASPQPDPPADAQAPSPFSVTGEEEGSFPGDWAPLKGKSVRIISIQQVPGTGVITSPQTKMKFAESLFRKQAKTSTGLVLIFDSEDGGMIAATGTALDLWKSGSLSDAAFWRQCYRDPPEILGSQN
jgi:hypothetical protein